MDIGQNIKNNQIAWGVGLSVLLILILGGGIIIQQSSLLSFGGENNSSQNTSSQKPAKERDPVPENPGPQPKIQTVNGTITQINREKKILTVDNSVATQNNNFSTIEVEVTDDTKIVLHTRNSSDPTQVNPDTAQVQFSTQDIPLDNLRKGDRVAISLVDSITEGERTAEAKRIQVQGY